MTSTSREPLEKTLEVFDATAGPCTPLTASEIAENLDCTRRTAYDRLDRLSDRGDLRTKKIGARGRVWWRDPSTAAPERSAPAPEQKRSLADAIVNAASVGVFVLTSDFEVAWANETVGRYFGIDPDGVVGEDKRTLVDEVITDAVADPASFAETVISTYDDNTYAESFECRVLGGDGRDERWLEHRSEPIDTGEYAGGRIELYYDVTDRKRANDALSERDEQFEAIIDAIEDDALFVVDADGDVVRANDRAEEILGGPAASGTVTSVPFRDADGSRLSFEEEPVGRTLETGEPVSGQVVQVPKRRDDEQRWFSVTTAPITDEDDEVEQVVVNAKDVTRLKHQAHRLERQRDDLERELAEVFERIDDAFYAVDDEFRFQYVNDQAEDLLQRPASELLGERVWDVFPGATETDAWDAFHTALEAQEATSFETYFDPLDFWVEANVYPSESGLSVYFRDVTGRKERERELEQYERIVEAVGDGVYALDDDLNFVLVNEAFCELVGWERDELLGRHATTVYDDDLAPEVAERADEVATGDSDVAVLEFDIHTRSGDTVPVESRFVPFPYGDGEGRCGVVRDVSERIERERELVRQRTELQERERALRRAYEVIADPDRTFSEQVDELLQVVRETVGTDYATLSQVQDDEYHFEGVAAPPDAALEAGETVPLMATICQRVIETGETLVLDDVRSDAPELADRADDADWGISRYLGSPVTVDDEVYGTFCFYDDDAGSGPFSDWQAAFVDLLGNWVGNELERQRYTDRLAAINELNDVARDVTDAVIDQSTREEIERTVCDRLAAADSYEFAWIAEVDPATGVIESRTEAGIEGYLEAIDLSASADQGIGRGPAGAAFRTRDTQVSRDVFDDPAFEPWRSDARQYGFRSSAAIPIVHEDTLYGVIGLYSERVGGFAEEERRLVDQLGEIVGHAIAAAERKRALMSDEVVEVEFRDEDFYDVVDAEPSGTITFDQSIPVVDDEFLVYGTASADATDALEALVEAVPHWESVSFRSDDDSTAFELKMTEPPVLSTVASLGGEVDSAVFADGDFRLTVHLSPSVDVRQLIDVVRERYDDAEMVRRQQISRTDDAPERSRQILETELTDRQRAALQSAYHSGFFAWPRKSSGEEVATSLGVSPPTFHQHLRKAEEKVFDALLGAATAGRADAGDPP